MNTTNLQLIANHIRTIPQEDFDMSSVYKCVIGHAYNGLCEKKNPHDKSFNQIMWFDSFIEFKYVNQSHRDARRYMVATMWNEVDNTPEGAAKRIEHVIAWLENPVADYKYFDKLNRETFPGFFSY